MIEVRDLRNGDWYWIHKAIYNQYTKKIGAIGLALYNAYCHYANKDSGASYPSVETLCNDLGVSRQTIFKYNDVLEKNRLIKIKSGRGRKKVNEVYLLKIKVNVVNKKVNLATEKVNKVDTEQELRTRITNNKGLETLRETVGNFKRPLKPIRNFGRPLTN